MKYVSWRKSGQNASKRRWRAADAVAWRRAGMAHAARGMPKASSRQRFNVNDVHEQSRTIPDRDFHV
eukprot:364356-Chlamydomonas_euryale.AAC.3